MPVSRARHSTTSGRVASSSTTTSGFTVRITDASGASRPAPPRRMLYERMRTSVVFSMDGATRRVRPLDERQIRLIEQSSTELDDDFARGLDVDWPTGLYDQRFPKRDQRGCNIGIVLRH